MNSLIIKNATISTPTGNSARKGAEMAALKTIPNGAIVVDNGIITYVGPQDSMPQISDSERYNVIDAGDVPYCRGLSIRTPISFSEVIVPMNLNGGSRETPI